MAGEGGEQWRNGVERYEYIFKCVYIYTLFDFPVRNEGIQVTCFVGYVQMYKGAGQRKMYGFRIGD